ncbi:MAG TPA: hypothetical protein DDZ68_09180 [Parvularcula sp.]|nr:hypothetical protein [Parvularcula sp.]HBS32235.1 hypothetical protein [Parvularcula sp.]HBS34801.1 hypothetical protein [Parvularcula sp.]
MARLYSLALALCLWAAPVGAETVVIRPDPCPAGAEQPLIIDLGEVEVFNDAPGATLGNVLVIYPPAGEGWASARLLMRFDLEGPVSAPFDGACAGAPRLFRRPR